MVDISTFFIGFMIVNAVALALLVGFAAVEATRFFRVNRSQRIARQRPIGRYYARLAFHH